MTLHEFERWLFENVSTTVINAHVQSSATGFDIQYACSSKSCFSELPNLTTR